LAQTLLLLCFWPALDGIFRRRFTLFSRRPQDLASEIVSRFAIAVCRADAQHVHRLTATLLRNTERDIVRLRRAERKMAAKTVDVTQDVASAPPLDEEEPSRFGLPPGQVDDDRIAALSEWLRRNLGDEAEIVIDAVFGDRRRTQIASSLGISHAAARKRLERALSRARVALLTQTQSQPVPPLAFAS
jgi:RNA polymerase sigma-70 factor (ECF subfamily)